MKPWNKLSGEERKPYINKARGILWNTYVLCGTEYEHSLADEDFEIETAYKIYEFVDYITDKDTDKDKDWYSLV